MKKEVMDLKENSTAVWESFEAEKVNIFVKCKYKKRIIKRS